MYSSVMLAHGHWACAYRVPSNQALSGPIYPLVSASIQWITRIGFSTPFPSSSQIGVGCKNALASFLTWEKTTEDYPSVLATGLVAWLALCSAGLALLQTLKMTNRLSPWLFALVLTVTPPVFFAVQENYHPQDLWALAMIFAAVALWFRARSYGAGVFLALAVMSQPYTLLGVLVLVVVSTPRDRRQLIISGALTALVVTTLTYFIFGTRGLSATLIGTGDTSIHTGTWMAELHFTSGEGIGVSRVGPLAAALMLAWWCHRRRPDIAHDPVAFLGLLAACWSLRLVFEENLFGYYCAATGVTLIMRDVVARRVARSTFIWLIVVLIAFDDIRHQATPWDHWPTWVWQVLIAPTSFLIAFLPLRRSLNAPSDATTSSELPGRL
jgi:hypothetical protein